jgi:hypothetical protein
LRWVREEPVSSCLAIFLFNPYSRVSMGLLIDFTTK